MKDILKAMRYTVNMPPKMGRRSFFGSIGALLSAPLLAKMPSIIPEPVIVMGVDLGIDPYDTYVLSAMIKHAVQKERPTNNEFSGVLLASSS